jgi:hypothetical protein
MGCPSDLRRKSIASTLSCSTAQIAGGGSLIANRCTCEGSTGYGYLMDMLNCDIWYMWYMICDIYIYWYTIYIDIWYILIYDITWCTMDIQYRRHPDDRNILALGVLFLSAIRSGSWALYVAQFCPRWLVETCRNHVSKRRFVGGLTRFKRDWGVDQTDVYIYNYIYTISIYIIIYYDIQY